RLLGCSILLCDSAESVADKLEYLLQNPPQWQEIAVNGRQRMGPAGASDRIAQWLLDNFCP
ncbi:MAG: glycosyltransferase, partial [Microcystis panniformis]